MDAERGGGASRTTEPAAGTSAATDVSLQDYFRALRETDQAHVRERFVWVVGIGAIIWFEIQRRLENLNHENARLLKQQESSVSSDTYRANEDQRRREYEELLTWRKEVDRDRTQAVSREEFQQDKRADKRGALGSGLSVALVCIAFAGGVIALLTYIAATH